MTISNEFDPDFAAAVDYARYYRSIGLQVVPAMEPSAGGQWKRPIVAWREHENALVSDEVFDGWYGPKGAHLRRTNLGIITGAASGGVWILDLDTHKHPEAAQWWEGLLALHNNGMQIETATQRTGGGGLQLLFRAPAHWVPPTCKSPIGIDIRGYGGFAVLAPSMHISGQSYHWLLSKEPWEVGIANAPQWLIDAIEALVAKYGGRSSVAPSSTPGAALVTATPEYATTAFGLLRDGREDLMTRMVWARVVDMRRDAPMRPVDSDDEMMDVFGAYLRKVVSRIEGSNRPNGELLEVEGRGLTMMREKWRIALAMWDGKVSEHASMIIPARVEAAAPVTYEYVTEDGEVLERVAPPKTADDTFEFLDVRQIKSLPDPEWLVEEMLIDKSLSFVVGPPGSGKSFVVLNMALCIASKQDTFWDKPIVKTGAVIYISSEGVSDIKFRIMAWEAATGVKVSDAPFYLIHQSINFMDQTDVGRLLKTVMAVSKASNQPVAMVVVDTVSRVLPGADENLQKDMTLFVKACDAVRESFSATVVGVHHTSRAGTLRGSSVFDGAADSIFMIERESGEEIGLLKATKIKAAPDGWVQSFRMVLTPIGDIKGTESLYAKHTSEKPQEQESSWPPKDVCIEIIKAMGEAWDAGRPWSPFPNTKREGRYAATNINSGWPEISKDFAEHMIEKWQQNDVIGLSTIAGKDRIKGLAIKTGIMGGGYNSAASAFSD